MAVCTIRHSYLPPLLSPWPQKWKKEQNKECCESWHLCSKVTNTQQNNLQGPMGLSAQFMGTHGTIRPYGFFLENYWGWGTEELLSNIVLVLRKAHKWCHTQQRKSESLSSQAKNKARPPLCYFNVAQFSSEVLVRTSKRKSSDKNNKGT